MNLVGTGFQDSVELSARSVAVFRTVLIGSRETMTNCLVSIWPVLLSNRCPARTARIRGPDGHCRMPPSDPTQGVGPAPRQGIVSGLGWARSATALNNRPKARPSTKFNLIGHFLLRPIRKQRTAYHDAARCVRLRRLPADS